MLITLPNGDPHTASRPHPYPHPRGLSHKKQLVVDPALQWLYNASLPLVDALCLLPVPSLFSLVKSEAAASHPRATVASPGRDTRCKPPVDTGAVGSPAMQ